MKIVCISETVFCLIEHNVAQNVVVKKYHYTKSPHHPNGKHASAFFSLSTHN